MIALASSGVLRKSRVETVSTVCEPIVVHNVRDRLGCIEELRLCNIQDRLVWVYTENTRTFC